jgi:hypothetical protein
MKRIIEQACFGSAAHPFRTTRSRLTVVEIGEVESEREVTIGVDQILYLCSGRAAGRGRVEASWVDTVRLRPAWIYVRTAKRLYGTSRLSIAELLERLPENFEKVNHGVVVNDDWIRWPELRRQRTKRVGMLVAGRPSEPLAEWVSVSRRHAPTVRDRIVMGPFPRQRTKPAAKPDSRTDVPR